ncbi:hypothetical protein GWK47_026059 [Chionoecetes opilio]|uniref:Uncharacterized protein n=1 Tax=Chionoecetes opilio TaxID=41210 RepID=A0A8J8WCR8_CHIOP|nr:hypothetical protein GWK47_026059 [Chionoecetes opilio]
MCQGHRGAIWKVLWHFVPGDRAPEEACVKVAQVSIDLLVGHYGPTDSLIVLQDAFTTNSRLSVHVDQKAWTDWQRNWYTLGKPSQVLLQVVYFKLYYDIKAHHRLADGPKHNPHVSSE